MALSKEKIEEELAAKKFKLVDAAAYKNLSSPITVECQHGHRFQTTMKDVREFSFECPLCNKPIDFKQPDTIPSKGKYRVIGFDDATKNFGLSIYDDGKLSFYHLYEFSGATAQRFVQIRRFINDVVIKAWKPDFIVFEDIQQEGPRGYLTFKVLAALRGIVEEVVAENNIPYAVVMPTV